jgi:hypothetical protein
MPVVFNRIFALVLSIALWRAGGKILRRNVRVARQPPCTAPASVLYAGPTGRGWRVYRFGYRRLGMEMLPAGEQFPQHPCVLVGQRHRSDIGTTLAPELDGPLTTRVIVASGHLQRGASAVDQQRAQIAVALFGDRQQHLLAAAGADLQVVMAYRYPGGADKAAIELHPVAGRKSMAAAKTAGLAPAPMPALLV